MWPYALSALALRQAAQESAAAAQLERCAALELGLQAALDGRTAILQGFMDDLCAGLAGRKVELLLNSMLVVLKTDLSWFG